MRALMKARTAVAGPDADAHWNFTPPLDQNERVHA